MCGFGVKSGSSLCAFLPLMTYEALGVFLLGLVEIGTESLLGNGAKSGSRFCESGSSFCRILPLIQLNEALGVFLGLFGKLKRNVCRKLTPRSTDSPAKPDTNLTLHKHTFRIVAFAVRVCNEGGRCESCDTENTEKKRHFRVNSTPSKPSGYLRSFGRVSTYGGCTANGICV